MANSHGMVWWSELMTRDIAAARAYYEATCGWSFETMPMPEGEYHVASRNGVPTAGMMDMTGMDHLKDVPAHWFTYFAVDDVDAACAATRDAGGVVMREPWDMPGTGRIAILQDPTGAAMGLMTPDAAALAGMDSGE